jgi:hypothetical protein
MTIDYKKLIKTRQMRQRILALFDWLPDKQMLQLQYRIKTGRKLDLDNPQRFTEKLQWYKLNYRDPLMMQCADKIKVRDYVESCGFGSILNTVYGIYDNSDDIDFDVLPDTFVVKSSLGSGGNEILICTDKARFDQDAARFAMKEWQRNASRCGKHPGREWVYESNEPPRILIEEYLESESPLGLVDYKFFFFNGAARYMYVTCDRRFGETGQFGIYQVDGFTKTNNRRADERPLIWEISKPENFGELYEAAERLAESFPHARIDLYDLCDNGEGNDSEIRFGEITFFDGSGYMPFDPDDFDYELGGEFVLPLLQGAKSSG